MGNMKRLAAVALAVCALVQTAQALSTVDQPASILKWPKIVVDATGQFHSGAPIDTLVQLSNTSPNTLKQAHCVLVNANSHCADNPTRVCLTSADCVAGATTSECEPGWNEIDFDVFLTFEQPLAWYAGDGLQRGQFPKEGPFFCNAPLNFVQCFNDAICAGFGCNLGQSNLGSGIPPAPEDPFIGSLTCVQYTGGTSSTPDQGPGRNALTGEAAIVQRNNLSQVLIGNGVDVAKYNAVGLTATGTTNTGPSNVLQIGGDTGVEYGACPATLILSHLFDFATDPLTPAGGTGVVATQLTLVPCGDDIATQTPGRVTAQFLVFNEFEQRFSTSRTVDCLYNTFLSTIDTRNPIRSIFSAGVAGSIAGQTRIRGVGSSATGRGLLGVAQLFVLGRRVGQDPFISSAAYNLHQQGNPIAGTPPDLITIP